MTEIKIRELIIGDWVRYDRGTDAVQIMGMEDELLLTESSQNF